MSALPGWPLNTRLGHGVVLILGLCLAPVIALRPIAAQMPRMERQQANQSPPQDNQRQFQADLEQVRQPLRFAREATPSRSVVITPEALAIPIEDRDSQATQLSDKADQYEWSTAGDVIIGTDEYCDAAACSVCGEHGCFDCASWTLLPKWTTPSILQKMAAHHDASGVCWSGQLDAVLFWRNAPPARELAAKSSATGLISALDAQQLNSETAGGPRIGILRKDSCGNLAEFVYLSAGSFRSLRPLPDDPGSQYESTSIFGITRPFSEGSASLGSLFQTFEANSRTPIGGGAVSFISGFRWLEWQESFAMNTSLGPFNYAYASSVVNSLYGGQIGVDAWLITMPWLKVDSWLKGGAYYNNAVQHTSYTSNVPGEATFSNAVSGAPAAGSFVGEVGINGIVPVSPCVNFRFGYTAFWLESIALATQQLSNQNVISTNGGTVLQGVNFGFEGNW